MAQNAQDFFVISSLVSAPAWVPTLTQVNAWLTTISLTVGIVLGVLRLYSFMKERYLPLNDEEDF